MKAILLSIKPKQVAKILNGEKTIEIRKTKPKCDLPIDVYIYCCEGQELQSSSRWYTPQVLNSKVVAKFRLEKVDKYSYFYNNECGKRYWFGNVINKENKELLEKSCLTYDEIEDYTVEKNFYALHITNLEMFDKPINLTNKKCNLRKLNQCGTCGAFVTDYKAMNCYCCTPSLITKPPKNFMYVEVIE